MKNSKFICVGSTQGRSILKKGSMSKQNMSYSLFVLTQSIEGGLIILIHHKIYKSIAWWPNYSIKNSSTIKQDNKLNLRFFKNLDFVIFDCKRAHVLIIISPWNCAICCSISSTYFFSAFCCAFKVCALCILVQCSYFLCISPITLCIQSTLNPVFFAASIFQRLQR